MGLALLALPLILMTVPVSFFGVCQWSLPPEVPQVIDYYGSYRPPSTTLRVDAAARQQAKVKAAADKLIISYIAICTNHSYWLMSFTEYDLSLVGELQLYCLDTTLQIGRSILDRMWINFKVVTGLDLPVMQALCYLTIITQTGFMIVFTSKWTYRHVTRIYKRIRREQPTSPVNDGGGEGCLKYNLTPEQRLNILAEDTDSVGDSLKDIIQYMDDTLHM